MTWPEWKMVADLISRAGQPRDHIPSAAVRSRLRRLLRMAKSYSTIILVFAFTLTGLATVAVNSIPPVWQASTTVVVPEGHVSLTALKGDGRGAGHQGYLSTHIEVMTSRYLAEKVIANLGLLQQSEYQRTRPEDRSWWSGFFSKDDSLRTADPLQIATNKYLDRLSVEQAGESRAINVSVESNDPQRAVAIANAHAEAYLAYTASQSKADEQAAGFALRWMSDRLNTLLQQLESAEERLEMARRQPAASKALAGFRDFDEATLRLAAARGELATAKTAYLDVYQGRAEPRRDLDRITAIAEDESVLALEREYLNAKARVAEMAEEFGRDNLNTLQAEWDEIAAQGAVKAQMLRIAERIRAEYEAAAAKEAEAARVMQSFDLTNVNQSDVAMLQKEVDVQRELYNQFEQLVNDTVKALDVGAMGAQIISAATLPQTPVAPRRFRVIVVTMLSSLLAGILAALIFGVRKRDGALHSIDDVESLLGVPLLGAVPAIQSADIGLDQSIAALREDSDAIVTIAAGIARDCPGKAPKIIFVTSAVDGEGKTTIARHLAFALAKQERVLLIDADLRKSVLPGLLVAPGYQGLTELLANRAGLPDVIKRGKHGGVGLMEAGLGVADPLPLLSSSRVDSMFRVLSQSYDRIVVDGPAVDAVDDSVLLARHANSVVFVTRCDDTAVVQVRDALDRLRRAGIRITGLVLNRVDRRKKSGGAEVASLSIPAAARKDQSLSQIAH